MLAQIKIASPCTADWDQMEGTDRVRFCAECKKNVFNITAMTRSDAEMLLQKKNGDLCTRLFRRADGTVLTDDCPTGLRMKAARTGRRLSWAIAGALGLAAAAFGQTPAVLSGTVTYDGKHAIGGVTITVTDPKTGNAMRVQTDAKGTFKITSLESGSYKVQASSSGFQQYSDEHVTLPATGEVRLNIQMAVGTTGGPAGTGNIEPIPSRSKLDPRK